MVVYQSSRLLLFLTVRILLHVLSGEGPSKRLNAEQQRLVSSPVKELDNILALLAAAVPVDVMPGKLSLLHTVTIP